MDKINNAAVAEKAVYPPPEQPTGEAGAAFAGHDVNITNRSAPPPYSVVDPEPPPAYTPVCVDITERLCATSINDAPPASLEECFFALEQAYNTNFEYLANTLSLCRDYSSASVINPFWCILNEVINKTLPPNNNNKNLKLLAERLWTFVLDAYNTLSGHSYRKLSQLTVVASMYFLEEHFKSQYPMPITRDDKVKPESVAGASSDDESLLPAMVRREFFCKLYSAMHKCNRADALDYLDEFVATNPSGLKKDLDHQQPVTVNLKFSGLRYEDIPGTTLSKKYTPKLEEFSRAYKIDLARLVEVIGQTRPACSASKDILGESMKQVARETLNKSFHPKSFFADQSELFRDRNSRCILTLMDYCQRQVFNAARNSARPEAPEIGEKCNVARRPAHESSASSQRDIQQVLDKLLELLVVAEKIKLYPHEKDPEVLQHIKTFFEAAAANNGWG
ncbi:hypothetical protein J7438_19845 [Thalassotalea sp. G20_0]|uniref:hypothetical protein n=1 Tax=Thalassotalea sp. G20_0 TaxID=2821093 RepID=UPI001ADCFEC8|nr:hypothetical protein [Thalassotalea sp. G20_0]MBO9496312.1 hypothetical protein [Thalassotalea sp. G20_0]